jgi:hypothetical protein
MEPAAPLPSLPLGDGVGADTLKQFDDPFIFLKMRIQVRYTRFAQVEYRLGAFGSLQASTEFGGDQEVTKWQVALEGSSVAQYQRASDLDICCST